MEVIVNNDGATMLKLIIVEFVAIFLTGCSSPGDIRSTSPNLDLVSQKSSKTVAICIADKWENGGLFATVPVNMRPTTSGYTMSWLNGMGGVGLLVDVDDLGTGSKTQYFQGGVIGAGRFEVAVLNCQ